ncbi:protein root UVB sensitive 6 isoform X2 [Abrus precatorius]|uniref:Protein root UVB sensitive 6 isoform X2 n=1 Tax=Abrus precatorius TaxID=3816 RepID=A0A8B8JDN1_ABRPR|nr:protein root UVB sensitive 6 isoform X2 [Abrus precatorius]
MAPNPMNMSMKQSANSTSSIAGAAASSSQDILIRETLRISANLASTPLLETAPLESSLRMICCEEIDGRRWKYVAETDACGRFKKNSFRPLSLHTPQAPLDELMSFVRSYVVPEGFPDSVTPSYVPYMTWRALKHFFGGAMGVFTTQTLLSSVGVSRNRATPGAVAINWILKDGAGRVGKMLFARQGKKFDYDLKQLRFAGDLLMELGAGVELATAAVPHLFLPLACAANVVKNVAAVTSTSTRTPIYKAFAKGENIGDVTAKGECVGNIADLLGTGLSILIAKRNPSLVTTFSLLSCGYILSSYREVKSVVLHTLNSARFSVAVESFLRTGRVPTLQEGNMNENIFSFPWKDKPVVLGSRVKEAFQDPGAYVAIEPLFDERYIVTYNPSKHKVYAVLKDQAKSDDILKAAFHAHVLMSFIKSSNEGKASSLKQKDDLNTNVMGTVADLEASIADSCKIVAISYGLFKNKAKEQGWTMSESLLNPGRARLYPHDNR